MGAFTHAGAREVSGLGDIVRTSPRHIIGPLINVHHVGKKSVLRILAIDRGEFERRIFASGVPLLVRKLASLFA